MPSETPVWCWVRFSVDEDGTVTDVEFQRTDETDAAHGDTTRTVTFTDPWVEGAAELLRDDPDDIGEWVVEAPPPWEAESVTVLDDWNPPTPDDYDPPSLPRVDGDPKRASYGTDAPKGGLEKPASEAEWEPWEDGDGERQGKD